MTHKVEVIRELSIKGNKIIEHRTYKTKTKIISKKLVKSFSRFIIDEKNRSRISKIPVFSDEHFYIIKKVLRSNNFRNN